MKEKNKINNIIETSRETIKEFGLEKLIYSTLPPKKYISANVKSLKTSIQKLKYDKILHEIFKEIPTRQGSKKSIGKQKLIEEIYGLNRYYKEKIEKADFSYMDKAIQQAKENQEPTSINRYPPVNWGFYNSYKPYGLTTLVSVERCCSNTLAFSPE